jgi:hypothetical protein
LGAATALAAVLVAVLAIVIGGGGNSLSVQQATALTLSSPQAPAPEESSSRPVALMAAVQGVHFPYWEHIGWRSTGQRTDKLAGHTVRTVFYANPSGQRIGYAIVAGTAPGLSGGAVQWRNGTPYRLLSGQGTRTVVWLRHGHHAASPRQRRRRRDRRLRRRSLGCRDLRGRPGLVDRTGRRGDDHRKELR